MDFYSKPYTLNQYAFFTFRVEVLSIGGNQVEEPIMSGTTCVRQSRASLFNGPQGGLGFRGLKGSKSTLSHLLLRAARRCKQRVGYCHVQLRSPWRCCSGFQVET